jgi:hypothetical protein
MGRTAKLLILLGLIILLGGAIKVAESTPALPDMVAPPVNAGGAEVLCTPGDQDQYIYSPERLQVLKPCIRITGTVDYLNVEDDGDVHFRIGLDPPYRGLLADGNKDEGGDLVVEPVCYALPLQANAMRLCASNPDRIQGIPQVADHVWMEGRYVLDLGHSAWSELHPMYRWGMAGR